MRTDSVIDSTEDVSADAVLVSSPKAKPWGQGIMGRVAANLWLLTNLKDWASINAMKGRSQFSGIGELGIRGLDHPLIFRHGTTDIPVVWELFHNAEYECDPGRFVPSLIAEPTLDSFWRGLSDDVVVRSIDISA